MCYDIRKGGDKMKKIIIAVLVIFAAFCSVFYSVFFAEHELELKLIAEAEYDGETDYSNGEKYFFIKQEKNLVSYDGEALLEHYLPDYDVTSLDTQEHTYFILLGGKDPKIYYDGMHCNLRKSFFLPEEYIADITYTNTVDGIIRIYETKKINIDYDYHSTRSYDLDTASWTLTNDSYTVVPLIEDTVSFYVNDMDGRTVFHWGEEGGWRKWDFKSITLCEDNTILITTGDMGEQRLLFDGESWYLEG